MQQMQQVLFAGGQFWIKVSEIENRIPAIEVTVPARPTQRSFEAASGMPAQDIPPVLVP